MASEGGGGSCAEVEVPVARASSVLGNFKKAPDAFAKIGTNKSGDFVSGRVGHCAESDAPHDLTRLGSAQACVAKL